MLEIQNVSIMHFIADIKERFTYFSDLEVDEIENVLKGQRGLRSRRSSTVLTVLT